MKCKKCGGTLTRKEEKEIQDAQELGSAPVEFLCDVCFQEQHEEHMGEAWEDFSDADPGL